MAATPGTNYTVQPNDTLSGISQQAYGTANDWQVIYDANTQVIGPNPSLLRPGEVLFIPVLNSGSVKTCKVTAEDGVNVRTEPSLGAQIVATYPRGTVLNYVDVVTAQAVDGNRRWGQSEQGHYFWLGATDHPNG